jgi:general secretion pathway protein L
VRLALVPRALVQAIVSGLSQAGLRVVRIETGDGGAGRTIRLADGVTGRTWLGPRAESWAWASCAALAVLAVALPFAVQAVALDDIDARIAALRPGVAEAEKLRRTIASMLSTAEAIADARAQVGSPLQAIAVLTEALPDDTYLTLLTARQRKLSISGRSAASARLIGAMAAHGLLQNPSFAAPVLRDETNGGETFSIRAEFGR